MYAEYFGLNTLPFSAIATLENTYRSRELKEALTHISYAIENHEPLLLLTGEAGCGKTTSIQVAVRKYSRSMSVATLSHTTLTPREFLEAVAIGFKMQPAKLESKPKLMQRLEAHFSQCMDSDRPALLFVDEAQLLKPPSLEELRLFSNLTRNGFNLVQVVLVGQTELEKHVKRNRSLCQRIGVRYRLGPLSREETGCYISHRLGAAGNPTTSEIFSEEAIDAVYQLSGGFPRQINAIAGFAMLTCFAEACPRVNAEHVESVSHEYGFIDVTPARKPVIDSHQVETPKEPTQAVEEATFPEEREEDETGIEQLEKQEQEQTGSWTDPFSYTASTFSLDSPRKRLAAIGLLVVASLFIAWAFMPSRSPSNVDDTAVRLSAPQTDAPNQESPTTTRVERQDPEGGDATPGPVKADASEIAIDAGPENRPSVARKPRLGGDVNIVIKRDEALAKYPDRPVTVQISAILDPELADSSLAKATSKTNIPGAIETMPSGEKTWYLVLLGCFDSAEEAEVAIRSTEQNLREMGVSQVRIKPAPRWLRDRLTNFETHINDNRI